MRSDGVVVTPPFLNDDLSLQQGIKDLPVQKLVAHLSVERFNIAVLPRTSWLDEQRLDLKAFHPVDVPPEK